MLLMKDSAPLPGKLPPIPDGSGILPVAENRIAHGPAPELLDAVPAGFDLPAAPDAVPPVLNDALEHTYRRVLARALGLTAAALFFSAFVALSLQGSPLFAQGTRLGPGLIRLVFGAQVVFLAFCSRYVTRLGMAAATILLAVYAAFTGMEYSLLVSPRGLGVVFFCAGGMCALTAVWGYWKDSDLSRPIVPVFMILCGGVLLVAVNLLAATSTWVWGFSALAVVVFALLEGYHGHEIRDLYQDLDNDNPQGWEASVLGALLLFMNSANFYLFLASMLPRDDERDSFLSGE
ncbi:MAG: Bax inhibitor-1 family protein [Acidobacteriota bacterium]|nr:Bax inhibitor-1 family protein [Acidobacteriota bacterium]